MIFQTFDLKHLQPGVVSVLCGYAIKVPVHPSLPARPMRGTLGFRQRADRAPGRHEVVHNLVCCSLVGWAIPGKKFQAHEVILPPIRLANTSSPQIAAGLSRVFELHLLGTGWEVFLQTISKSFSNIHFAVVADSAAANLKFLRHWLKFLRDKAKDVGVTLTATFTPCLLQQMSRIIDLNLQRQGDPGQDLSSALYSISRLSQHSVLRDKTMKALHAELIRCFRWRRGSPPDLPTNQRQFRSSLLQILAGSWGAPRSEEEKRLSELFGFFNGDLLDAENWHHYCGERCCKNEQDALNKATVG